MTNDKLPPLKVVPKAMGGGGGATNIAIEIHEFTIVLREHYTFKGKVAGACLPFMSSFRKRAIKCEQIGEKRVILEYIYIQGGPRRTERHTSGNKDIK